MITQLNHNSNSWTKVFKIDLAGSHPNQEYEEYFATQLDIITTQQYNLGYYLRGITRFDIGYGVNVFILVFTPEKTI